MKDYYQILEVPSNASLEKIIEQHRSLLNNWQPDKFPDPAMKIKAGEKTMEINEAFDVLSNPTKWANYDKEQSVSATEESRQEQARTEEESRQKEDQQRRVANNRKRQKWGLIGFGIMVCIGVVILFRSNIATKGGLLTQAPDKAAIEPPVDAPKSQTAVKLGSNQDGMEMVAVPAGEFQMGSKAGDRDQKPVHTVYLDAYWIDKTEVTNAMYAQCVASGKCQAPKYTKDSTSNAENQPVVGVSWSNAITYCTWAGRRLPSEAEWEKAARGTDGRIYPWGNQDPDNTLLNYNGEQGSTTPVGQFPEGASPYGALDMAGNAWEWVNDWYGEYPSARQENPMGPASGKNRVLRGGCWDDSGQFVRAVYRNWLEPNGRLLNYGFRCASSAAP